LFNIILYCINWLHCHFLHCHFCIIITITRKYIFITFQFTHCCCHWVTVIINTLIPHTHYILIFSLAHGTHYYCLIQSHYNYIITILHYIFLLIILTYIAIIATHSLYLHCSHVIIVAFHNYYLLKFHFSHCHCHTNH